MLSPTEKGDSGKTRWKCIHDQCNDNIKNIYLTLQLFSCLCNICNTFLQYEWVFMHEKYVILLMYMLILIIY